MAYGHAKHAKLALDSKNSSKAVPNMAFFSNNHGQNGDIDMATKSYKINGQKSITMGGGIYKHQMDKLSSTT